jgi:hypothetical protein
MSTHNTSRASITLSHPTSRTQHRLDSLTAFQPLQRIVRENSPSVAAENVGSVVITLVGLLNLGAREHGKRRTLAHVFFVETRSVPGKMVNLSLQ